MDKAIESIEADIDKHRSDASNMLGFIGTATIIVIIALFITVAPEIAERFVPSLEESVKEKVEYRESAKKEFKEKYSKDFYYLSEDDFEDLEDDGLVKDIDKDARRISKLSRGPTSRLELAKLVSKMAIANEKSDLIFKAVPILFIAVFIGSLFTYRFHMQIVRDLSLQKTQLLIDQTNRETPSNNALHSTNNRDAVIGE